MAITRLQALYTQEGKQQQSYLRDQTLNFTFYLRVSTDKKMC